MKYKIEIWQYHIIAETYESDDLTDILSWFRSEWLSAYDMGYCSFNVYEDGRELSFDELYGLGFYD